LASLAHSLQLWRPEAVGLAIWAGERRLALENPEIHAAYLCLLSAAGSFADVFPPVGRNCQVGTGCEVAWVGAPDASGGGDLARETRVDVRVPAHIAERLNALARSLGLSASSALAYSVVASEGALAAFDPRRFDRFVVDLHSRLREVLRADGMPGDAVASPDILDHLGFLPPLGTRELGMSLASPVPIASSMFQRRTVLRR
jgi:hypothetical protein